MAIQRPQFQVDGEDGGLTNRTIPNSGGTRDFVNITGPGFIEAGSYNINQDATTTADFGLEIALEMVVDGVEIFDQFLEDADRMLQQINSGVFKVVITVANDLADIDFSRIAFKTSFILRLRNDDSLDALFLIKGATLSHKGV